MDEFLKYMLPDLVVLIILCYFMGKWIKGLKKIDNAWIPFINTALAITLSAIQLLSKNPVSTYQEVATLLFTAITQGVLASGGATLYYEGKKQAKKLKDAK